MIPNWPERIHAVGIGGGGMSALAAMFADEGHEVSGSDRAPGPFPLLDCRGVVVSRGHDAIHLDGHGRGPAEFVIRSAAVPDDNPELVAARALGLPILKYSEALGRLMLERPGVAVAGTHGKTTTTALLAHLLTECGRRPGWAVGGGPLTLPAPAAWGDGHQPFVVEACEYDDSFLNLHYDVGVVLSIAPDHLDWFGDEAGVRAAFRRFCARVPSTGTLVLAAGVEDESLVPEAGGRIVRAGDELTLVHVDEDEAGFTGALAVDGDIVGEFRLPLMGRHNLFNLQAALAAARALDVPLVDVLPHVATFRGVGRRLQAMGSVAEGPAAGALVIDDFAHHPEELLASAAAVRGRFPGRRVVAVYQPHQVSRTEALLEGFAEALGVFDEVLLCDIFVARDRHPERAEASCERLVAAVRPPVARRVGPAREARSAVLSALRPDDVCLVMGAGDIDELAPDLARTAARP